MSTKRPEKPTLSFGAYAIALHFALESSGPQQKDVDFASFERDMLSYSYRREPPFWSRVIAAAKDEVRTVELRFPARICYEAEGEQVELICPEADQRRKLDVKASRTDFPGSGISVLHLVFVPAASEAAWLNEYDLVKITKLWERGEGVDELWGDNPKKAIFVVPGEGEPTTVREFAEKVFSERTLERPRVGTIQLLTGEKTKLGRQETKWSTIWESVVASGDQAAPERVAVGGIVQSLVESARTVFGEAVVAPRHQPAPERVAVGGIIQGLLDFERIDAAELTDVFQHVKLDADGLFGIHKGTLVSIAGADRMYGQLAPTIGISPYLLLPQAVLLHNEHQLDQAERAGKRRRASQARGAELQMRDALNVNYLPNVFHYEGERQLYETGAESRALSDRLNDLQGTLEEVSARRRVFADDVTHGLLLFIAAIQIRSIFENTALASFLVACALIAVAFYLVRRLM